MDIKSGPELVFGFNKSHILNISVSDILENSKSIGFLPDRKLLKLVSVEGISDASF